uniref:Uncharacterized protein n=1 Tax=Triticum urartu TaxID=4572 RepID=A0A8R7PEG7_TRIUA
MPPPSLRRRWQIGTRGSRSSRRKSSRPWIMMIPWRILQALLSIALSALSQLEFSPKRRCNVTDLAKGAGIGNDYGRDGMDCEDADAVMEGVRFLDQSQRGITPCAELKDKGLCLVPLSMLLNYQG